MYGPVSRCRWMGATNKFSLMNVDGNGEARPVIVFRFCYTQPLDCLRPEEPEKRRPQYVHPECEGFGPSLHDFVRQNPMFHEYSLSSQAFIDLVNDMPGRLRLRITSRSPKSPINENGFLYPPTDLNKVGRLLEEHFASHEAKLWPPDDAPELLDLLCPSADSGRVKVMRDEYALIYSTQSVEVPGMKDILLIDFDPALVRSVQQRVDGV